MKTVYVNMLKKFTVKDIENMRAMKREGWTNERIAEEFDCAVTTAMWHTADIKENYTKILL